MEHTLYTIRKSPLAKKQLYRKKLNALLTEGINGSLITVSAGAGYGKTQMLSTFLDNSDDTIVWMQLSPLDNLPCHFWKHLVRSVALPNPPLADTLKDVSFPDTLVKLNAYLHTAERLMNNRTRHIIVLDDFHLLTEKRILWLIESCINACLPGVCTILLSRTTPALSLTSGIRSHHHLHISQEDLRFSPEEVQEYLQLLDLNPTDVQASKLYSFTEGWPLSIQLAGIALTDGSLSSPHALDRTLPPLFHLIEQEIFSHYTEEVRKFLVKLSFLDSYDTELVHLLAGELAETIPLLTETNMFMSYNPYTSRYHLHHLFVQFLQTQPLLSEQEKQETWLLMADWYMEKERKTEALITLRNARQYEECWSLLSRMVSQCFSASAMSEFLLDLIEEIRPHIQRPPHQITLIKAMLLLSSNSLEEASRLLDQNLIALTALEHLSDEDRRLLGDTYTCKGILSFCTRSLDLADNFRKACEYLPDGSSTFNHRCKMMDCNFAAVMNHPGPDELKKMQDVFFQALPYTTKVMGNGAGGRAYLCRAEGSYFQGNMEDASDYALHAIYKGEQLNNPLIICLGMFIMTRIAFAEGNYNAVEEYLGNFRSYETALEGSIDYPLIIDIAKGWFACKMKTFDNVPDWILDDSLHQEIMPAVSTGRDKIVRAQYMLYQKKFQENLAFLKYSDGLFNRTRNWIALLASKIMQSISAYYLGRTEQALVMFQEAYKLSCGNHLDMAFIEYGNYMRTLTNAIMSMKDHGLPLEWLKKIQKKSNTYAKRNAYILNQHYRLIGHQSLTDYDLTSKELAILQDLCQGLTREEIALEYNISINTVKSKLQMIYNKLGALNVADAVRIAVSARLVS